MSEEITAGTVLGGRYLVTSEVVGTAEGDLVFEGTDQVLNRAVSILVAAPANATRVAVSAREVAMGTRPSDVQVLDLGLSGASTYLITNTIDAASLLDLAVESDSPYIEPFQTDTLGQEIFGEARAMEPQVFEDDAEYYQELAEEQARRKPRLGGLFSRFRGEPGAAEAGASGPDAAGQGSAGTEATAQGDEVPASAAGAAEPMTGPFAAQPTSAADAAAVYDDTNESGKAAQQGGAGNAGDDATQLHRRVDFPATSTGHEASAAGPRPDRAPTAGAGAGSAAESEVESGRKGAAAGSAAAEQGSKDRTAGDQAGKDAERTSGKGAGRGAAAAAAGAAGLAGAAGAAGSGATASDAAQGASAGNGAAQSGSAAGDARTAGAAAASGSGAAQADPAFEAASRSAEGRPASHFPREAAGAAVPPADDDFVAATGGGEGGNHRLTRLIVGLVLVVVLVGAVVLAVQSLTRTKDNGPVAGASSSAASSEPAKDSSASSASASPTQEKVKPKIEGISIVQPQGVSMNARGDSDLSNAVDGSASTSYQTYSYKSPVFGGFTKSMTLAVKLEKPSDVSSVELSGLNGTGGKVAILVGKDEDVDSAQEMYSGSFSGPTLSADLGSGDDAQKAQYVFITITELPRLASVNSSGLPYGFQVAEIKVD